METPRPNQHHDRLERFCGSWSGTVTVKPNPQLPDGMTGASRAETTRELDGWFVVMKYEQRQPDGNVYTARGVIGYDDEAGQYTFYWFDSQGWNPASSPIRTGGTGLPIRRSSAFSYSANYPSEDGHLELAESSGLGSLRSVGWQLERNA